MSALQDFSPYDNPKELGHPKSTKLVNCVNYGIYSREFWPHIKRICFRRDNSKKGRWFLKDEDDSNPHILFILYENTSSHYKVMVLVRDPSIPPATNVQIVGQQDTPKNHKGKFTPSLPKFLLLPKDFFKLELEEQTNSFRWSFTFHRIAAGSSTSLADLLVPNFRFKNPASDDASDDAASAELINANTDHHAGKKYKTHRGIWKFAIATRSDGMELYYYFRDGPTNTGLGQLTTFSHAMRFLISGENLNNWLYMGIWNMGIIPIMKRFLLPIAWKRFEKSLQKAATNNFDLAECNLMGDNEERYYGHWIRSGPRLFWELAFLGSTNDSRSDAKKVQQICDWLKFWATQIRWSYQKGIVGSAIHVFPMLLLLYADPTLPLNKSDPAEQTKFDNLRDCVAKDMYDKNIAYKRHHDKKKMSVKDASKVGEIPGLPRSFEKSILLTQISRTTNVQNVHKRIIKSIDFAKYLRNTVLAADGNEEGEEEGDEEGEKEGDQDSEGRKNKRKNEEDVPRLVKKRVTKSMAAIAGQKYLVIDGMKTRSGKTTAPTKLC